MSQFSFCLLVWMFYSRKVNNYINRIHKRTLKLNFYSNHWRSLQNFYKKDDYIQIHHKNIN